MIKRIRQINSIIIFLILLCFFNTSAVFAKTFIGQDNICHYNVKVNIVFDFKDQSAKKQADFLLDKWQKSLDQIWNGSYGSKTFGAASVDFIFNLKQMLAGESCLDYPNYHCIDIVSGKINQRGNVADALVVAANSSKNSWGEWSTNINDLNVAHEAGHMMGLGEEYHYEVINGQDQWVNDNYKKSGPQSIMAQTWGNVTAFREQTKQIIEQAGFQASDSCWGNERFAFKSLINEYYSAPLAGDDVRPEISSLIGSIIKGQTDPAVYLVDQDGKLRHLANETVAKKLLGANWQTYIISFNDAIIYTYEIGEPINS